MRLSEIYAPIKDDLDRVEQRLKTVSRVESPRVAELVEYSLGGSGKRIRPALTLLAGRLYDYDAERLLLMATSTELMHAATLVHDDAIDRSVVRWGRPTLYMVYGEERAVLLGDYLFAEAGAYTAATENLRAIKLFAETLKIISAGQLDEISMAFNPDQTREQYLRRISGKTAALFVMATECGAVLSRAPGNAVQVLREYGYNLGIAFQIVDDILDFTSTESELGKPVGSDLIQGTLTLPAMLLLERVPGNNPVRAWFQRRDDRALVARAIELVRDSTIVTECYTTATDYTMKACAGLGMLPDTASRRSLYDLAKYVVSRRR